MIYDLLSVHERYHAIHPLFKKAFRALDKIAASNPEKGKIEIEGDALYCLVNEYTTLPFEGQQMEAHRKYIDIQVLLEGEEQVGIALKDGERKEVKIYDETGDYALFGDECSHFLTLKPGQFCIFFPEDLHMPNLIKNIAVPVKKLVIKVAVNG